MDSFGWLTPIPTFMLAYAFFGLDALGDELEEPFGLTQNDLPLYAIARIVSPKVSSSSISTVLPEPLQPVNFVLQ